MQNHVKLLYGKGGTLTWKVWDIMVQFNLIFQADAEHLFMFPTVVEKQKSFDLSVTPKNP